MSIYLDYAATTPVDPRVVKAMQGCLTIDGVFGNPASNSHHYGDRANQAVNSAREQVASLIGASHKEIIWTSGATESDNLAIKGIAQLNQQKGKHIITAKTEHKAVLDTCAFLSRNGFEVTYLDPDKNGVITRACVENALRSDTILVSIMYANNETGIINDITNIGKLTREKNIVFHVDGAQAAGKLSIDVDADNIDLLSLTAHKIYGPKGIGALYVRRKPRIRLQAQIHGGGHERGFRSGTLPTHQIVGMGEAYRLAEATFSQEKLYLDRLAKRFWEHLSQLPNVAINGKQAPRLASVLNIGFEGIENTALLVALGNSLAVSTGSACISATPEPSYVLRAMGLSDEQANSSVRFSFGRMTTKQDIDRAAEIISRAIRQLS